MSAMLDYLNARAIAHATFIATSAAMPMSAYRPEDDAHVRLRNWSQAWTRDYLSNLALFYPEFVSEEELEFGTEGDQQLVRMVLMRIDEAA